MAANLNDAPQTIEPYAVRIFKGLKPDVVAIQEFNYGGNSAAELRYFVDDAFGTNFVYYREPISGIPNGVISRYPFLETGSWADPEVSNRGFAWARIDLPGTNDLYVVSVHLLTSSAGERSSEANSLKALIQANFPAGSWIVVAGDFNTQSRTETCITTFNSFLSDNPIPTDSESAGKPQTNKGRTEEYDYILASHSMTNRMTNTVFASRSFARGLVFDSRVYTPLSDVSPVQEADSGLGQHMAVLKDFAIPFATTNAGSAPVISTQPRSQTNSVGANVTFSVVASGGAPLTYIWEFGSDVVSAGSASSYTVQNVSKSDEGAYVVVVTNMHGKATSDVATLTVTLPVPYITQQPQHQAAVAGSTVVFSVTASGAQSLSYQWRSNELNIAAAGFVFIAVMLWRRHRSLTCRCDRERERERRAYWGFE